MEKTISNSEINNKYVLALVEGTNKMLSIKRFSIASSDFIISEIEYLVEDPNKTLWDIYTQLEYLFDYSASYALCFPFEYNNAFIDYAVCPKQISPCSIDDLIKKRHKDLSYRYKRINETKRKILIDKLLAQYKENMVNHMHSLKKKYAQQAKRFIRCQNLNETLKKVVGNASTKMYSTDNIGWTSFKYSVSDDVIVIVKTNFGYGNSSYFYLAIKYKDIVLIPYSDLVHYYYANMKNLISYTRSYALKRDSWRGALEFVADFVNASMINPEKFIHDYVIKEIEEMIKGLRETMRDPSEVLTRIKDKKIDYISMKVIRPFIPEDQRIYDIMPRESISVFKAEKITGAVEFLNSLRKIMHLCPEIKPIIAEIIEMNKSIKPDVEATYAEILEALQPLEKLLMKKQKELERLIKKLDTFKKDISKLQTRHQDLSYSEIIEKYKSRNPDYAKTANEHAKLQIEIKDLSTTITRRKRLRDRIKKCLARIN